MYLSLQQRLAGFTIGDLDDALYERRSLARLLGMRRTMFVVPLDLAAVIEASCTKALIAPERRRTVQLLEAEGIDGADALVGDACAATLAVLREGEPLPGRAITPIVTELQQQVLLAEGKPYEARVSITNRILLQLSIEGHIVRTRPLGSWLSSQYRWTTIERWFTRSVAAGPGRRGARRARAPLAAHVRAGDDDRHRVVGEVDEEAGRSTPSTSSMPSPSPSSRHPGAAPVPAWVLPDDVDDVDAAPDRPPSPCCRRSTRRSWAGRSVTGSSTGSAAPLFDRNGNAGPIVLVDGVAVGAWAQVERRPRRHRAAPTGQRHGTPPASSPRRRCADGVVRRRARDATLPDTAADRSRRRRTMIMS